MEIKKQTTIKSVFEKDAMKAKLKEVLGKKAATFTTSVLQLVSQSKELAECDPISVVNAAMVAATLELPINQNLGFAYVIPYNVRDGNGWKKAAQFQLGYKGFKQLALRTGQFKTIHQTDVRLGEVKGRDRLTGEFEFEWIDREAERLKAPIVGYVSFFELLNGFKSTFYMSVEELEAHARKYSKVYAKSGVGLWKEDKKGMCEKTVTKLNLSKNAPISVEDKATENLIRGLRSDQSVINDFDNIEDVDYIDNDGDEVFEDGTQAESMENEAMNLINSKK